MIWGLIWVSYNIRAKRILSIPRFIYIVTCLTLILVDNFQMDNFPLFISHCSYCSIYWFFLVNGTNFWKSLRPCLGAAPTHAIRHQGGSPREPSKHLACHGSCKTSSREGAGEGHGREVGYVSPEWLTGGLEHFIFFHIYIGNNHPNWLIFFRRVQTTNQMR